MLARELRLPAAALPGLVRDADPYTYQRGFGNHHVSEAIPGALPLHGVNLPRKGRYGLYAEHLNATSFISSRNSVSNVWMYRERPAAAHRPVAPSRVEHKIESCFLPTNPNVSFTPLALTWGPLSSPDLSGMGPRSSTFVQGLRTICGHGDPTIKEGLAVHQYAFDADMHRQAFVNHDGEMLLVPQQGTLDIKTELGGLWVPPGTIAVLPAGIRYSVRRAPAELGSSAAGYALEIFGSRFCLPEMGALGANGLARVHDFEYPVAAFDFERSTTSSPSSVSLPSPPSQSPSSSASSTTTSNFPTANGSTAPSPSLPPWEITAKICGRLHAYSQPHTPFDVVAWHGRCAPYRYDLSRFAHLTGNADQLDPTAYCVLTAPSKWPDVSLVDFCVFGEKWTVSDSTLRMPYYHRTVAAELCGIVRGNYGGSVRQLEAGGLSFEQAYMPHGETYEAYVKEVEADNAGPSKVARDYLGFMFHVSSHLALTKWAMEEHPDIRPEKPNVWDSVRSHLVNHLDDANASLIKAGLPPLDVDAHHFLTPPGSPHGGATAVPDDGSLVPADIKIDV